MKRDHVSFCTPHSTVRTVVRPTLFVCAVTDCPDVNHVSVMLDKRSSSGGKKLAEAGMNGKLTRVAVDITLAWCWWGLAAVAAGAGLLLELFLHTSHPPGDLHHFLLVSSRLPVDASLFMIRRGLLTESGGSNL